MTFGEEEGGLPPVWAMNVSAYVKVSVCIAFLYTEVAGRDQLVLVEPNHIVLES